MVRHSGECDKRHIICDMFIGVLALSGCWASGLVTIIDVVRGANTARQQVDSDIAEIKVATVGIDRTPVRTAAGVLVPVDFALDDDTMNEVDLLVVPALTMNTPAGVIDALMRDEVQTARGAVRDWVRAGRPVAAACTGTFVRADAGVLDTRRATTSWWLADEFARRFPRVKLDMSRMVVADGPVTTAGAAFAHIDLAMHIVAGISPQLAGRDCRHSAFRPAPGVKRRGRSGLPGYHRPPRRRFRSLGSQSPRRQRQHRLRRA